MSRRSSFAHSVKSPRPVVIDSITPNHGPEAGGTSVTIEGSGFTDATHVRIHIDNTTGEADDIVVVSDAEITCTVPEKPMFSGATVNVYVTTPDGVGVLESGWTWDP